MNIELTSIAVPDDVDAPDAVDFRMQVAIRNRMQPVVFGEQAVIIEPAQGLPAWQDQTDERIHGFLVRVDGEPVGRAILYQPMEDGSHVAETLVEVLPEWWGRGIGRLALARLESLARELGRPTVHCWSTHLGSDEPAVTAATGAGSVPRDHATRFLLDAGYRLEQVNRSSALDLATSTARIETLLGAARQAASGYRYVSWTLPTPPEYADDYAYLKSRMSTDAPAGALEFDEQVWDAERVARVDATRTAQGFFILVGAAEHIASGRLVAFTELGIIGPRDGFTIQFDTLVQSEHRGHRLGMLVKGETLTRWREIVPESPRIITGNAEENRPMLDVNEAMGFVPIAYSAGWQKTLS